MDADIALEYDDLLAGETPQLIRCYDRANPFEYYSDENFRIRYRMKKSTCFVIINNLSDLEREEEMH